MKNIMTKLRTEGLKTLGGKKVTLIRDIGESISFSPADPAAKKAIPLPKSNVLQFFLEGGSIVSARPSGTEPKIKFYVNCVIDNSGNLDSAKKEAQTLCSAIEAEINAVLQSVQA
jgi:phosphoglucomutase